MSYLEILLSILQGSEVYFSYKGTSSIAEFSHKVIQEGLQSVAFESSEVSFCIIAGVNV